jgi:hypothetical protein
MTSERALFPIALVVVALSSCVTMEAPTGFLTIERGPGQLKATTAEDSRLWVREFDDDAKGELGFWIDTVKNDFTKNRGYTLIGEAPSKDASANEGHELVFEATVGGKPFRELLAIFVLPGVFSNTIRVVEFVAPKERFEQEAGGVRASIAAARP